MANDIINALSAANNANIIPTIPPFSGDLASIEIAFDLVTQSVNARVFDAETEAVAATKHTKVNAAAAELQRLLRQLYNMILFIDDFGYKNAGFMTNQKMVENTYKTIGFPGPFPPPPPVQNAVDPFLTQLKTVSDWNTTFSTAGTLAVSEPALSSIAPGATFQTFKLPPGTNNVSLLSTNAATAAGTPGDDDRIANIKDAAIKFKNLFNFFDNIIKSIQALGQSLEKSTEDTLKKSWPVYKSIIDAANQSLTLLPPSGAVAGIYARIDDERGVWKAPANVSVTYATGTAVNITDNVQKGLNVDVNAGKSINVIRTFSGKGTLVWGARTLAGNDNEWRYISVRRFFNMVEESVKKSTAWAVFEPNDANTWVKVKSMIENYLTLLWRQGALAGAKPEEAFFVEVGLNKTMTFVDILEGRMIVKIGMAAVRPAEFIILEFSHKIQTS
ncbi:MAG: phage tail sheath family protein [Parafilimonas sp.]|nr:phage tail sheath family protein [Parafilimonas sp.]